MTGSGKLEKQRSLKRSTSSGKKEGSPGKNGEGSLGEALDKQVGVP